MPVLKSLIVAALCAIPICRPLHAELMQDFITQAFDWKIPSERPHLMLSRGVVLAWLKDPSTFLPVDNAQGFYSSGDRSLVIVPPGTALIAFPPRSSRRSDPSGRLRDPKYQLAVTRDGFWGIIDTAKERLFLDEPDLVKMSAEEKDGDDFPKFGMLTSTAYTAKPPTPAPSSASASPAGVTPDDRSQQASIPLTRGEIFRILADDGENLTIDFNSNFAGHAPKPGSPAQPLQLTVPRSRVASFRLSGEIVPREQLDQWRRGSAEYSVIFGRSFANVRVPAAAIVRFGCGETTTLTQKNSSNKEIKAGFEAGAGGSFWTWLKAKIDISGSISGESGTTAESSFSDKSLRHGTMSPIEYRNGGGQDELFWAGTVQTCHSTPNWQTIAVRSGGEDHYLHNEMYQLGDDGKEPPVGSMQKPTQPTLDGIEPGGNPFDRIQGIYKPKCFPQALNFEQLALQAMPGELPYRIDVAIAIKTSPQLGDLTRFYSDLGCGTAKTGA